MILHANDVEAELGRLLQAGELESFLALCLNFSKGLVDSLSFQGSALFLPRVDQLLMQAGKMIAADGFRQKHRRSRFIVHVATELYNEGGHTKVLEDIARILPDYEHVVIVTNLSRNGGILPLGTERKLTEGGLRCLVLEQDTLLGKVKEVRKLLAAINPAAVFAFPHHHDVVANVALDPTADPVVYFHHCDHEPALGATRNDFLHVDFTREVFNLCRQLDGVKPLLIEPCVAVSDQRRVSFSEQAHAPVVLTCGSARKYLGRDRFSYAELVSALFAAGAGKVVHIGGMAPTTQAEVVAALQAGEVDFSRFVMIKNVPSLRDACIDVSPDMYLVSHPSGGGKAMIEAMSVGLPILMTRKSKRLLEFDFSGGQAVTIDDLAEVPQALKAVVDQQQALGDKAFDQYQANNTMATFNQRLRDLLASPQVSQFAA